MKTFTTLTFAAALVLSLNSWGAEGKLCVQAFERDSSFQGFQDRFESEFFWELNSSQKKLLRNIFDGESSDRNSLVKSDLKEFLSGLSHSDPKLVREAELTIQQKLTFEQQKALLISRIILRSDKAPEAIQAVDQLLENVGITADQRLAMQADNLIADRITKFNAQHLVREYEIATPAETARENENVLKSLTQEPLLKDSKRTQEVSPDLIQKLYGNLKNHPVAKLMRMNEYDPTRSTGFCFGRAFTGHLEAIKLGIDKNSIRKVFVAGQLEKGEWEYHVAVIVRGERNEWYAIDPIFPRTLPVSQWYAQMKAGDISGKMKLFVTEAERFGPRGNSKYSNAGLLWEGYNNYFRDVIKHYSDMSKAEMAARSKATEGGAQVSAATASKKKFSDRVKEALKYLTQNMPPLY